MAGELKKFKAWWKKHYNKRKKEKSLTKKNSSAANSMYKYYGYSSYETRNLADIRKYSGEDGIVHRNKDREDLCDTLAIKYKSEYSKKRNPDLYARKVGNECYFIQNGNRTLRVYCNTSNIRDKRAGQVRKVPKEDGYFVVINREDVRDYEKLTKIVDRSLKIK